VNPDANEMGKLTYTAGTGAWEYAKIAQTCCPRCERVKEVIDIMENLTSDLYDLIHRGDADEAVAKGMINGLENFIPQLRKALK
jgi:hypothetical protein